jgi:PAS domain S-box-containing protein
MDGEDEVHSTNKVAKTESAQQTPIQQTKLIYPLIVIMVVMLIGMSAYQLIKYLLFPNISLIGSNIITVLFSSTVATIAGYSILHNRQRTEERLKKSETKYRIIADNTYAWEFWLNPDGKFIYVSPSCKRITGYDADEFLADPDLADHIIHPDDRSIVINHRHDMGAKGVSDEIEFRIIRRDGSYRWVSHICQPVFDEDGHFLGRRGSNRDSTLRKQAEEELKRTSDELARSNADLQQFAMSASHDLQEPLRVIEIFIIQLARRYKDKLDKKADEFIEYTVDGVKRMQQLIKDLLEYSKVGTKGIDLHPTDFSRAVDEAVLNLKTAIEEIDAVVTRDELPTLAADTSKISRLFQNLIGNALKFHGKETLKVHISAERKGNEWVFSVKDNGIGIDPTQAERVFVIFQRLHVREEYPGTGIGLAICKRIVERHGGRIWVESKPRKGSTFHFTIPDRQDVFNADSYR